MSADPVFISADRLTDPQSLNLYAYVRNNPLSLVDPTGLDFYLACQTPTTQDAAKFRTAALRCGCRGRPLMVLSKRLTSI